MSLRDNPLGELKVPLTWTAGIVFLVVLIAVGANMPALQQGNVWLNTAAYAAIVALLWVMVRTRFLFRIVPT